MGRAGRAVMDADSVSRRPVPPGPGGAADQLVITATHDLRDIAVPCTCACAPPAWTRAPGDARCGRGDRPPLPPPVAGASHGDGGRDRGADRGRHGRRPVTTVSPGSFCTGCPPAGR